MPFCPVPRPSLLRTPGHLPSGLARQQRLRVGALGGKGLSTFFLVLKLLFSWQSERNQTPTLFLHETKGNPTDLLLPVGQTSRKAGSISVSHFPHVGKIP